jgi:hypothetical protein
MKKSLILGAVVLSACVLQTSAQTVQVVVDGNNYEVSTITTGFDVSSSLLESQVWWENPTLAEAFTTAVGQSLGASFSQAVETAGPLFDYDENSSEVFAYASYNNTTTPYTVSNGGIGQYPFTFAIATPVPESAANPALLAAAGLFVIWRAWRTLRPVTA